MHLQRIEKKTETQTFDDSINFYANYYLPFYIRNHSVRLNHSSIKSL